MRPDTVPTHDRGIPSGYLSALEQRLHDTEAALISALVIQQGFPHTSKEAAAAARFQAAEADTRSKSECMSEWQRYPLAEDAARRAWLELKLGDVYGTPDPVARDTYLSDVGDAMDRDQEVCSARNVLDRHAAAVYARKNAENEHTTIASQTGSHVRPVGTSNMAPESLPSQDESSGADMDQTPANVSEVRQKYGSMYF